jgi:hypothetical protein
MCLFSSLLRADREEICMGQTPLADARGSDGTTAVGKGIKPSGLRPSALLYNRNTFAF